MAISLFSSFRTYVFSSILLTTAVLSHAIFTKRFFYRSVVHLSKSKFAILAVTNMALVTVLLIWRLIQAIFLGPLRFRETERLHIRARDAIIECCFAISVFRQDLDQKFVALVMTLLLLKSLHWLTKDRIEFLEEQPLAPRRTHIRLVGLMLLLATLDSVLVTKCVGITFATSERSMFVLFAFEFTLLQIELLAHAFKYIFLLIDTRMDNRWDSKSLYTFYSELICDMCQLTIYIIFFIYVQIHYSFPFHIIRELYMIFHKFRRRCADFLRYRRVVATMNDLFADATEEELAEGDRTCIICREEMNAAKKLACGHMFHPRCLQSWLKRQLTCPTCRATIDVSGNQNVQRNQQQNRQPNVENPPPVVDRQQQQQQQQQQPQGPQGQQQRPPGQQPVNIGDAGQRLLNFANDWWNQVMNDAGVQGQNQRIPPMLHGPNALAHRQLRQRRRGAWPGVHQPLVPPGMQQNPFIPFGQRQHLHQQHLQQHLQQLNQHQQHNQQQQQVDANRVTPMGGGSSSNAGTSRANANSQSSTAGALPSQAPEQPSSSTQQPSSTQPGSTASTVHQPASNSATPLPSLQTLIPQGQAVPEGTAQAPGNTAHAQGGQRSTNQTTTAPARYLQPSNTPVGTEQNVTARNSSLAEFNSQSFPLARLLAIQEQIEILRSEVQTLVLIATNPPSGNTQAGGPSSSTNETNGDGDVQADVAEASESQATPTSESNPTSETRNAPPEDEALVEVQGGENDAEADRLRQRRIAFLERRTSAS